MTKSKPKSKRGRVKRLEIQPVNNGFWDLPAEERAARMESACEYYGEANFFDLSPEERGRAYDQE